MGSEVLVIFAFQIYFWYINVEIGLIVTVFLAGLLPGAWLGNSWRIRGRLVLLATDLLLILLLAAFVLALHLGGNPAAARAFSADLIGAACGTLATSAVLIPWLGLHPATLCLIGLKSSSLVLMAATRET